MLVLDSSIESGFTCLLSCSVFISQSKNPAFCAESLAKTLLGMNSPDNILLEKAAPVPPGTPADCRPPPQGPPTRPSSCLLCRAGLRSPDGFREEEAAATSLGPCTPDPRLWPQRPGPPSPRLRGSWGGLVSWCGLDCAGPSPETRVLVHRARILTCGQASAGRTCQAQRRAGLGGDRGKVGFWAEALPGPPRGTGSPLDGRWGLQSLHPDPISPDFWWRGLRVSWPLRGDPGHNLYPSENCSSYTLHPASVWRPRRHGKGFAPRKPLGQLPLLSRELSVHPENGPNLHPSPGTRALRTRSRI